MQLRVNATDIEVDDEGRISRACLQKLTAHASADVLLLVGTQVSVGEQPLARNDADAAELLSAAAERCGDTRAMVNLADLCRQGRAPGGAIKAADLVRRAADEGDPLGQSSYARHLYEGIGVAQDKVEAVKYWEMAADQGDATGLWQMAQTYHRHYDEVGRQRDGAKALRLLRAAAAAGSHEAAAELRNVVDAEPFPGQWPLTFYRRG